MNNPKNYSFYRGFIKAAVQAGVPINQAMGLATQIPPAPPTVLPPQLRKGKLLQVPAPVAPNILSKNI